MNRLARVSLRLEDKILLSLFVLFIIIKPFYFWRSGLPQPADFIYVLLILMLLLRIDIGNTFKFLFKQQVFILSIVFAFWVFLCNSIWTIILSVPQIMFPTIYYFYNVIVFTTVLILVRLYGELLFIKVFSISVVLSLSIQFFLFLAAGGYTGGRQTINFNNPNQLGYYGLLALVSVFYVQSRIHMHKLSFMFATIASSILILISLSKAAIVSVFMLIFFHFLHQIGNIRNRFFIVTTTLLIVIIAFFLIGFDLLRISDIPLLDAVNRRLLSISKDSDDSFEGRGYDRLYNYPEYWIFGAGEGAPNRYSGSLTGEFHSTLGNIQLSYGLIGTILFLSILLHVLKPNNYADWYLIMTLLTYGLTHNGIRNTLFWILLGIMAMSKNCKC